MTTAPINRRLMRATSLYHRVRRRLYHRTGTKREVVARRTGFYRDVWDEAAAAAGGSVLVVKGALLEISCGNVRLRTRTNLTSLDDPLTVAVSEDKPLVYRLLGERGVPVPRHVVCAADDLRSAWAFVGDLGRACVVKPARGTSGAIGITTGVTTRPDLVRAMAYAGAFGADLLIEEMVRGGVYRLLFLDGELLDAVLREPPAVHGDGHASLAELVAAENARRLEQGIAAGQSLIKIDGELRHKLSQGGRSLRSVPAAGEVVVLKNIVNDNCSDDNSSAADLLSPALVATGAEAAAAIGVRLAGVDVIASDPAAPLERSGGVVIEVNAAPGYYYHYFKRDGRTPVATMILERLVRADA